MPQIFQIPRAYAVDGNGKPYAGARAFFYVTGTSTPKTTYSDYALSVPNANPVVADSNGLFPSIFLATDTRYRVVMKTSVAAGDVTLYTQDDAGGGGITSDSVTFTPAGTGATARTVQSKLRDVVSVKDFGAVGDGTTDDTTSIQAALNTGKRVIGVAGETYVISTTLTFAASNQEFDGQGCNFKASSSGLSGGLASGIYWRITGVDNVTLKNFTIPYNSSADFGSSVDSQGMPVFRAAIVIGTTKDSIVCDIKIVNDRTTATKTWNGGIACASGHSTNATIRDNVLIQTALGITYTPDSYAGVGNRALNNRLEDVFYGFTGSDPLTFTSYGNIVEGNIITYTTFSAYMGIEDYSGATNVGTSAVGLCGTRIVNNTITGNATSTPLYYAISAVSKDAVVEGNIITDWYASTSAGTAAIETLGNLGVTITNNVVRWTTSPEALTGTSRLGITVSGDCLNGSNRYIGNKIENAYFGIWLHTGATNTNHIIQGNSFRGCAQAFYNDGTLSRVGFYSNVITVTRPQTASRNLVHFFAGSAEAIGNIIEFEAASSQNTYTTAVFRVAADNVTIANNFGNCGGYSFTNEVIAIWASGATPTYCLVTNNTFIGGMKCYYDSFTQVQGFGNVVPAGVHGVSNNKIAFYDGQTPVVQPTGYGTPTNVSKTSGLTGTTATLAQVGGTLAALITDLKSQNLIGS